MDHDPEGKKIAMAEENKIQLFEGQRVRYVWDEESNETNSR